MSNDKDRDGNKSYMIIILEMIVWLGGTPVAIFDDVN